MRKRNEQKKIRMESVSEINRENERENNRENGKNKNVLMNNKGVGVVELILILVVLIGLVVIFRDQLTELVGSIFERIVADSNAI